MGYFSNLAAALPHCGQDHTYIPPEKQLLWRLEDLQCRLKELSTKGSHNSGYHFPENELRYILPEHLRSAWDVQAAIDLAVYDLALRHGILITSDAPEAAPPLEQQLTFWDLVTPAAA